MKNFVQEGDTISLVAPYTVTPGQGALVGALFGVAHSDVANGAAGDFKTQGVFDLTKEPALAISQGVRVFWDNTNRRVTTTATSNFCIGWAIAAALAADATVRVKLGGPNASAA
jgi:predicted RecA/RadA family phage recombinase